MKSINQTYIEEKVKLFEELIEAYGWEGDLAEDGKMKFINEYFTQALSDAIEYGEESQKEKQQQFKVKVIDKGKQEQLIFDFRLLEDRYERLRYEHEQFMERFESWNMGMNTLWSEINTMKAKLTKPSDEKKHRMYCVKSGMRCLVYHPDGICPDVRDCEACKDSIADHEI